MQPSSQHHPYRWFATLWPVAVLFHLAGNDFNLVSLNSTGLVQIPFLIAAVAMLIRPTQLTALLLALSHLPVVAAKLPVVGNHEILLLLIDLTVILAVATRRRDWLGIAVPPLRWVLLIAYSAIAFSKLNSSFVDRAVSCAVIFGDEFGDWFNITVSNSALLSNMVIAITLLAELSIPIMLMIRPLRRFGVVVGLIFHTLLALEPAGHVFDFTSVLFVLFLLFLTPGAAAALSTATERARTSGGPGRILTIVFVGAAGNFVIHRLRLAGYDAPRWLFDFPLFIAYAVWIFRTVLPQSRKTEETSRPLAFRIAPAMAVIVLLTSLNAASPYLELRTAGAFNMYSNLTAYDGETNHFLLPSSFPVRDVSPLYRYEPDVDERIGLDFYADEFLIPQANLAHWANTYPDLDVPVELVRTDGTTQTWRVQELASQVNASDSLIEKILYVRAIDPDSPTSCRRYWGPAH